ncbi:MAG: PAS domain-containing sensor histidine kinase [Euryarchaeota archaeon]|nr:PAS domain-containing sensor histidine kinase [Euryarchaeota archaeon]
MHKQSSIKTSELRKRSEDALKGKIVDMQNLSYNDARHLIHELQVHQIELEMQNEELRRAQTDLEELRKNYSDIYDFAPIGYFSIDKDGLIKQVNLTGAKKLGVERNFIINKPFSLFISSKSKDVFYDHLRNVFGTGIKQICELKVIGRNITQFDAQLESIIVQNGDKNSGYCRSVIVDITEHKNAEDILKISEGKYRTLLETMTAGVIFQDAQGNITYANPAAQSIFGLTLDQMKGVISKYQYLRAINEDGTDFSGENHPSMVALKIGKKVNDVVIGVFNKKKEEFRWINFNAVPQFRQGENEPYEVHTTFEDISERKKIEELRLENERFINMNNTRSEFFTILSHELRTPLTGVIGYSILLEGNNQGELNKKQKFFVDKIISNSKHLLDLINNVLDIAKIDSGKMKLAFEEMSVPDIINEILNLFNEKSAENNIIMKTKFDPDLPIIKANIRAFKQILFNLLSNAIKFSNEEGGIITVSVNKENDMAKISVSDTGIGIKEEDIPRLFQTFEQLDTGISRKYEGTGLGLAITKKLVELHGGKIRVESKYGEGSTFIFWLPISGKAD